MLVGPSATPVEWRGVSVKVPGERQPSGMLAPAGATDTWGGRPEMSVVKTTPIGVPARSLTLHASMSLEVPPTLWGPAVTPG